MAWYDIVHLDRIVSLTGVHSGGTTTWTLPFNDNTLDTIVLGPSFGSTLHGSILTPTTNTGTSVTLTGDYSAGPVVIGRGFTKSIELTRPFVRDAQDTADPEAYLTTRKLVARYQNTGYVKIKTTQANRSDREVEYDPATIDRRGDLIAWHNGNAETLRHFLQNDNPKPSTVSMIEFTVDYAPREGG